MNDATDLPCPPTHCADCRLRAVPAFVPVAPRTLALIESYRACVHSSAAGQTLIREGATPKRFYTLYSGWAFRYKTLPDGRRQILGFLLPGDLVGLQQEFGDSAMHGVEALTECHWCGFPSEQLWALYTHEARLGYDLTWLSARGEGMSDDGLVTVGRRSALERVAMLLIHLHDRLDRMGMAVGGSVEFPIHQQHMADALGLSLVHTNKTLRRLATLGLHRIEAGRLRILNRQALASVAEHDGGRPPRLLPLL